VGNPGTLDSPPLTTACHSDQIQSIVVVVVVVVEKHFVSDFRPEYGCCCGRGALTIAERDLVVLEDSELVTPHILIQSRDLPGGGGTNWD
jgi:hypothetical protein